MRYSNMRMELIEHLRALSDYDYQIDCWINGKCPDGIEHDELDYLIHFIFDDTELAVNPKRLIGLLLKNENEANLIQDVCNKIEFVFIKYGTNLTDDEYIKCPEWRKVVDAARLAYQAVSTD